MTTAERLRLLSTRQPLPVASLDDLEARIREALQIELTDVAEDLERRAEKTLKLYADISLDGEREAAAYRMVARDIRQRIEFMK